MGSFIYLFMTFESKTAAFPHPMHISTVRSVKPVEKIQIQISAGPEKHHSHHRQMMVVTPERFMVLQVFVFLLIRTLSINCY